MRSMSTVDPEKMGQVLLQQALDMAVFRKPEEAGVMNP